MARLRSIEIRTAFAPNAPKVLERVRDILRAESEDPRPGVQNIVVEMPLTDQAVPHCKFRHIVRRTMSDGTWREYRIKSVLETTGPSGNTLEITARDPIFDLADAEIIRDRLASGVVTFDLGRQSASLEEIVNEDVIARLPPEYAHYECGIVQSAAALYSINFKAATPLEVLEQVALLAADPATGLPAEFRVRQAPEAFYVDVLREIGSDQPVVDVRSGKNLASLEKLRDSDALTTAVIPFGADDGSGEESTIARVAFRLSNPAGLTYEITDPEGGPSPVGEDDQLNGKYLVPNNFSGALVEITDSVAGNPATVTLASSTGIVAGEVYELRADASGTLLSEVVSPSRILLPESGGYGRKVSQISVTNVVGARNFVKNPLFSQWTDPGVVPDGWSFSGTTSGGATHGQNTDALFIENGSKSWRFTIPTGAGAVMTAHSPLFFPRPIDGASTFSANVRLFIESFTNAAVIELRVLLGSKLFVGTIVPIDYPYGTTSPKVAAGSFIDLGIEGMDGSTVGVGGAQIVITFNAQDPAAPFPFGGINAYLDAAMVTQTPKVVPTYFEFATANQLWHAAQAMLAGNRDGSTSLEVDILDKHRLNALQFGDDELITGATVRITDRDGTTDGALVRIASKPRINWLEEASTDVVLAANKQQLNEVLSGTVSSTVSGFTSGGSASNAPTPTPAQSGHLSQGWVHLLSDSEIVDDGFPAESAAGTLSDGSDTHGGAAVMTTAASSGSAAFRRTTSALFRRDWRTVFESRLRTPADLTQLGIFAGFAASAIGTLGTASDPGAHCAGFRYHTSADGTAFWRCVTKDGSTLEVTASTVQVEPDTVYDLRVELFGIDEIRFFINEAQVAVHTTHLPALTTRMGLGVSVTTLTTAARALALYYYGYTQRSTTPSQVAPPPDPPDSSVLEAVLAVGPGGTTGSGLLIGAAYFAPGDVSATDIADKKVALWVAGVEVPIYCATVTAWWPDDSVMAVEIQTVYSVPSETPITCEIRVGTPRATTDLSHTDVTYTEYGKQRGIIMTNPTQLSTSAPALQWLQPTSDDDSTDAAFWTTYFDQRYEQVKNQNGGLGIGTGFWDKTTYDHVRGLLAAWARTGTLKYYWKARTHAAEWVRYCFPASNNSNLSPNTNTRGWPGHSNSGFALAEHHSQRLLGLACMWMATGCPEFRDCVAIQVNNQMFNVPDFATATGLGSNAWMHNTYLTRFNLRTAWAAAASNIIDATKRFTNSGGYGSPAQPAASAWPARVTLILDAAEHYAYDLGDHRDGITGQRDTATLAGDLSGVEIGCCPMFQFGLWADFLRFFYEFVYPDSRIPGMVTTIADMVIANMVTLQSGDTGFGVATYGHNYWCSSEQGRATDAVIGSGDNAAGNGMQPWTWSMWAGTFAFCYALTSDANYDTWYQRAANPANTASSHLVWVGGGGAPWKIFGEIFSNGQDGPYHRHKGLPALPAVFREPNLL